MFDLPATFQFCETEKKKKKRQLGNSFIFPYEYDNEAEDLEKLSGTVGQLQPCIYSLHSCKREFLCRLQRQRRQAGPDISTASKCEERSHTLSQDSQIPLPPHPGFPIPPGKCQPSAYERETVSLEGWSLAFWAGMTDIYIPAWLTWRQLNRLCGGLSFGIRPLFPSLL